MIIYNEILNEWKFTYLLKEADESKNMTIESILPASPTSYTGIDNQQHVSIGQFKNYFMMNWPVITVILDAKLDYRKWLGAKERRIRSKKLNETTYTRAAIVIYY